MILLVIPLDVIVILAVITPIPSPSPPPRVGSWKFIQLFPPCPRLPFVIDCMMTAAVNVVDASGEGIEVKVEVGKFGSEGEVG